MTAKESYSEADYGKTEHSQAENTKARYREDLHLSEADSRGTASSSKTAPPTRAPITPNRYLLSAGLFLMAIISCWLTTLLAPTPDNPFSNGSQRFSYHWWLEAQERNAPLKLPAYSILAGDIQIQAQGNKVLINTADQTQAATIDSTGTLTAIDTTGLKQTSTLSQRPAPQSVSQLP
jgi:hypothetical protein